MPVSLIKYLHGHDQVTVTDNLLRYSSYRKAPPSPLSTRTVTVSSTCTKPLLGQLQWPPVTHDPTQKWYFWVIVQALALWHCDTVTLWHCDTVTLINQVVQELALWHCDTVTLWHCDTVTLWHCDTHQPSFLSPHITWLLSADTGCPRSRSRSRSRIVY